METAVKLLFLSQRPAYPLRLGGAARSAHALLQQLAARRDFEVAGVSGRVPAARLAGKGRAIPDWAQGIEGSILDLGYPLLFPVDFERDSHAVVERFGPDLVLTQLDHALELALGMRALHIPVLWYVRDGLFNPDELRLAASRGVGLICVSRYLQDEIERRTGRAPFLARSIISFDEYRLSDRDPRVLMMFGPVRAKGFYTFLDLARAFPGQEFRVVESWQMGARALEEVRQAVRAESNLTFVRRVDDVRPLLRDTRWLLVPSVVPEGAPRSALEAQSCGIPVLGSRIGGIPEVIAQPDLLVDEYQESEAWVRRLGKLLQAAEEYESREQAARLFAASPEFSIDLNVERFILAAEETIRRSRP
jgi:glycosyltransferase involved in cell wall biosynthesis